MASSLAYGEGLSVQSSDENPFDATFVPLERHEVAPVTDEEWATALRL